jgi:hypothetical protein
MQIRLRFTLPVSEPTSTRDTFWQAYGQLARNEDRFGETR